MEIWNEDENWRRDSVFALAAGCWSIHGERPVSHGAPGANARAEFRQMGRIAGDTADGRACAAPMHMQTCGWVTACSCTFPDTCRCFWWRANTCCLVAARAGAGDADHAECRGNPRALEHGHSFCSLDALYPASGFISRVSSGDIFRRTRRFCELDKSRRACTLPCLRGRASR